MAQFIFMNYGIDFEPPLDSTNTDILTAVAEQQMINKNIPIVEDTIKNAFILASKLLIQKLYSLKTVDERQKLQVIMESFATSTGRRVIARLTQS